MGSKICIVHRSLSYNAYYAVKKSMQRYSLSYKYCVFQVHLTFSLSFLLTFQKLGFSEKTIGKIIKTKKTLKLLNCHTHSKKQKQKNLLTGMDCHFVYLFVGRNLLYFNIY